MTYTIVNASTCAFAVAVDELVVRDPTMLDFEASDHTLLEVVATDNGSR
jgi:hypothetical protein